MKRLFQLHIFLLFFYTFPAWAGSGEAIGLATGSKTGTYIKIGRDIAKYVAQPVNLHLFVVESAGSTDNIMKLTDDTQNTLLAIVQSDVLHKLKSPESAPELQQIAAQLRLIYPLYNEAVHLLAKTEIQQFSDLSGKKVNIGKATSGTAMTANNLFELARVEPGERLDLDTDQALLKLLQGEIDAMVYVGAKPNGFLLEKMRTFEADDDLKPFLDGIHFVPLDNLASLSGEYVAETFSHEDYPIISNEVKTLALKALLITLDISSEKDSFHQQRCRQLGQLARALRQNFARLQTEGEAKDKWQQIDLNQTLDVWPPDECAHAKPKTASKELCEAILGKDAKECIQPQ